MFWEPTDFALPWAEIYFNADNLTPGHQSLGIWNEFARRGTRSRRKLCAEQASEQCVRALSASLDSGQTAVASLISETAAARVESARSSVTDVSPARHASGARLSASCAMIGKSWFLKGIYLTELKKRSIASRDGDSPKAAKRRRRQPSDNTNLNSPRLAENTPQRAGTPDQTWPPFANGSPAAVPEVNAGAVNGEATLSDGSRRESLMTMHNALASGQSEVLRDVNGRRRFLGPSSTWAYSRQVMRLIKDHLKHSESPEVPLNPDGRSVEWPSVRASGPLSMDQIPSLDYAMYLTNTVKFHLGQLYHLFHEKTFMDGLYEFYHRGPQAEPLPGGHLWFVHFLLIMGFGQALLSGSMGNRPGGSELISRAIELLPNSFGLYQDPILSIEILCCLALYLQSIDHRNSAFLYIGQAMRMALSQGLHRELVGDDLTEEDVKRHRAVWWTIYILDRRFSSLMGAPNMIHDEDIMVSLPDFGHNSNFSKSLTLHVALSRLLATVLENVYGKNGELGLSFLENTQEVLRNLAGLASDLEESFEFRFDHSGPTSRVAATLNLYYHQCIVLATRPLLMCLIREMLENITAKREHRQLAAPIKALLKTSQESATKSLRILLSLQSQHLLESFLPFDLESTFSSAFILALMAIIPHCPFKDVTEIDTSFYLLNQMIARGSFIAEFRKDELERLLEFLRQLNVELSATTPVETQLGYLAATATTNVAGHFTQDFDQAKQAAQLPLPLEELSAVSGLSPNQMLSLAELLDQDAAISQADLHWLWTSSGGADRQGAMYHVGEVTDTWAPE
ncbi:hypothetical protein ACHAPE_008428 [Trichoderma viride]